MPHAADHPPTGGKRLRKQLIPGHRNSCRGVKSSSPGIIDANRKKSVEIGRMEHVHTEVSFENFDNNFPELMFTISEKCAFAHGINELKIQSLNDMEKAGRIPNAAKFRSYPCMTWVATGTCPYQSRCVFLHDPRLRFHSYSSEADVNIFPLYKSKSPSKADSFFDSKICSTKFDVDPRRFSSEEVAFQHNIFPFSGMSACSESKDFFFWPHVQRDYFQHIDSDDGNSGKLPPCEATYELSKEMAIASCRDGDACASAVYHLWYSLVESVLIEKGLPTDNAANGETPVKPIHLPIFKELAMGKEFSSNETPMPELTSMKQIESSTIDQPLSAYSTEQTCFSLLSPRSFSRNSDTSFVSSPRSAETPPYKPIYMPMLHSIDGYHIRSNVMDNHTNLNFDECNGISSSYTGSSSLSSPTNTVSSTSPETTKKLQPPIPFIDQMISPYR